MNTFTRNTRQLAVSICIILYALTQSACTHTSESTKMSDNVTPEFNQKIPSNIITPDLF